MVRTQPTAHLEAPTRSSLRISKLFGNEDRILTQPLSVENVERISENDDAIEFGGEEELVKQEVHGKKRMARTFSSELDRRASWWWFPATERAQTVLTTGYRGNQAF